MSVLQDHNIAQTLLHSCLNSLFNPFSQVLQWRAQQEEAAELEAAVAARRKEKEDEKERIQKEQEMIHRAQEKEKV